MNVSNKNGVIRRVLGAVTAYSMVSLFGNRPAGMTRKVREENGLNSILSETMGEFEQRPNTEDVREDVRDFLTDGFQEGCPRVSDKAVADFQQCLDAMFAGEMYAEGERAEVYGGPVMVNQPRNPNLPPFRLSHVTMESIVPLMQFHTDLMQKALANGNPCAIRSCAANLVVLCASIWGSTYVPNRDEMLEAINTLQS